MLRKFDNEAIRELNAACRELVNCEFDCFGIGWCEDVYEKVRKDAENRPNRCRGRSSGGGDGA